MSENGEFQLSKQPDSNGDQVFKFTRNVGLINLSALHHLGKTAHSSNAVKRKLKTQRSVSSPGPNTSRPQQTDLITRICFVKMGAGASVPQEGELTLDEVKAIATEAGKEWTEEMEKFAEHVRVRRSTSNPTRLGHELLTLASDQRKPQKRGLKRGTSCPSVSWGLLQLFSERADALELNFQVNAADGKIAASALASYKEEAAPSDAPADPSSGESNDPVESAPTNDGEAAEAEPTAEEAAESGAAENDEVEGEPAAAEAPTEDPPQQQEPEKPAEDAPPAEEAPASTSAERCLPYIFQGWRRGGQRPNAGLARLLRLGSCEPTRLQVACLPLESIACKPPRSEKVALDPSSSPPWQPVRLEACSLAQDRVV
eukprot:scaffold1740_cov254-Pinguiococcus_pyrenoidosus.AAC.7